MLKQCESCGKFFGTQKSDQVLCEECSVPESLENVRGLTYEEKKYELARDIVYDNPDISPEELIREMAEKDIELRVKDIMEYVKEGKMVLKNMEGGVFCEDCGKKMISGRRCPSCTKKFEDVITSGKKPEEPKREEPKPKGQRMHSQE